VLVVMFSYMQWNELRTGERFITTIPHSGFMISMMKASAHGAQIFVDDTPLDKLAREEFKDYHFREVLYIVKRLQLEYGFTEPQVMNLVQAKYKQTWLLHTGAMMRAYLAEISPRQALYGVSPLFSDLDVRTRTQGDGTQGPTSGGDKVRALSAEGSAEAYALLSLYGLQALVSITVSLAFFIYPLVLISQSVRARQMPNKREGTILALWAFYAGMIALVALSEFTPRYLMPVMPIVAVIGFTGLGRFVRFYRSTLAPR
jgi:4-amino-4-deoxy-L-arabinose transferase-like glycosyltransferase